MATVLLVDDDPTVRGVVSDYLRAAGHTVLEVGDGVTALSRAQGCDLVVLDLMLPGIDGHEVFRRLRSSGVLAPVIMLTAKSSEADRVLGLELGADDYLAKPFSPRELVLRVAAVLRRQRPVASDREILTDGSLTLDLTAQKASLAGVALNLTFREFDLLAHLVGHPDQVFSREELMRAVWGWEVGDASTVTVHVRRLRSKVETDPQHPTRLVTVWGRGYRWEPA
ncbi:response regulator transcription factor [Arachnia propionica]|uniref:response regulator transcription factor n=1 Tax=Arachnia propionica TaxID=1750 RepID=UPI0021AB3843|nr:response regulator transcription factor [Arachnia propionica]MDO5083409.1 response regulator transcription factor [Arachnia propionica]